MKTQGDVDGMKEVVRETFAEGRKQLSQMLRRDRERCEALERLRAVPLNLQGYVSLDLELAKKVFDKQLHLRLVLILTALESSAGLGTIAGLVQDLDPPGGRDEVLMLVDELVRRQKVTFDGQFVRRVR